MIAEAKSPASTKPESRNGRWLRWGSTLGRFATVQLVVQALNAITGLIVVRLLNKQDYALFTIASSMQTMLNLLTDCGINAGLFSIGGKVWNRHEDLGRLVQTALRLRRQMCIAAIIVVSPISLWLLLSNGASLFQAVALTAIVVGAVQFVTAAAVFGIVTKLHSSYGQIQQVDLAGALSRLVLVLTSAVVFLNAAVATLASSLSQIVQYVLVRRQALQLIHLDHRDDPRFRVQLVQMIKSQAFYFIFYALQGQLSVMLISAFGTTGQVADIGALSRLALIGAVFGAVINQVVAPAFARIQDRRNLLRVLGQVLLLTIAFGLACIALGFVFAPKILWLFGKPYRHLSKELVWMMVSVALGLLLTVTWAINTARGWLHATWLIVPLTLVTQVVLASWLPLSSVRGIILFSILAQIPNLLVSAWMCARGFARLGHESTSPPNG
jgi:O-antigen/teichoic acid export membrane protein